MNMLQMWLYRLQLARFRLLKFFNPKFCLLLKKRLIDRLFWLKQHNSQVSSTKEKKKNNNNNNNNNSKLENILVFLSTLDSVEPHYRDMGGRQKLGQCSIPFCVSVNS